MKTSHNGTKVCTQKKRLSFLISGREQKKNPDIPWPANFYTRKKPKSTHAVGISKHRNPHPTQTKKERSLFLASLDSGLGDLANLVDLDDRLDDTDGDGLTHVTDGETSKRRVLGEGLNAHGLGGLHLDDGSVTRLDELGRLLNDLTGTTVNLLDQLGELASNVGGVAVENGGVSVSDLTGVVHQDDLSVEGLGTLGGVVLGVTSNVTTTNLLDGDVLKSS
jgi:hypothetical protein